MAGKNLYLKLTSGEYVHVTDDWDGQAPTEEGMVDSDGVAVDANGKEVSDPYRDIHRYTSYLKAVEMGNPSFYDYIESDAVTVAAALIPTEPLTVKATDIFVSGSSESFTRTVKHSPLPAGFISSTSDEVAHRAPRQFAKVYTWLVFEDAEGGTAYKWRKAEIMGWGKMPPIDI